MKVTEGRPEPLGCTFDGHGANFSVFTSVAHRVELCFFDGANNEERITLPGRTGPFWHGYIDSVRPGWRYGIRVQGPWDPRQGHLCSPERLLLDPYAKAYDGAVRWDNSLFPLDPLNPAAPIRPTDTAPFVPKSVVVDTTFDWGDDRSPKRKLQDTVIYEVHVRGFTVLHPKIPPALRGTYAGLAHPASLEHLTGLGVTAVELLPIHQFIHRRHLIEQGLRNYWGYDPVGYFAPHNEYASDRRPGGAVSEFKEMVKSLHSAGLEVILDVVFNHTGEGGVQGPALSFKGFDNREYYCLAPGDSLRYVDLTGTQNTLNTESPHVQRMIVDSLAYWVTEMHVDGFRFDLAPVLVRAHGKVDVRNRFFDTLRLTPALSEVKLIAEPWDLGDDGYQLGRFPSEWPEWNDRFRDDVRGYWHGRPTSVDGFARRLAASPDIFRATKSAPQSSVNFVTCHDGFTLHDLVSYEAKHNQANGEDNRDGHNDNRSWNCGVEGETDDVGINTLRTRQKRNLLATLLLSQGVPMLLAGDEIGRTQRGNNNAYCQDNEISWFDWAGADRGLTEFVAQIIRLRRDHPLFHRPDWFDPMDGEAPRRTVGWHDETGREILPGTGATRPPSPLQFFSRGAASRSVDDDRGARGPVDVLVMFNPADREVAFHVPEPRTDDPWVKVVDTRLAVQPDRENAPRINHTMTLAAHSLAVLVRPA